MIKIIFFIFVSIFYPIISFAVCENMFTEDTATANQPIELLSIASINGLKSDYLKTLTKEQIKKILESNYKYWNANRALASVFTLRRIHNIEKKSDITIEELKLLQMEDLKKITQNTIDNLSKEQLEYIITNRYSKLVQNPQFAAVLSGSYISKLNNKQISTVSKQYLSLLDIVNIKKLNIDQIRSFTTNQVTYLIDILYNQWIKEPYAASAFIRIYLEKFTPQEVASLNKKYVSLLQIEDVKKMDPLNMRVFTTSQLYRILNKKRVYKGNIGEIKSILAEEYVALYKLNILFSSYAKQVKNKVKDVSKKIINVVQYKTIH